MGKLSGKIAMVTGGATGLGKAIARRLVAEDATVVITDVQKSLGAAAAEEFGFAFFAQDVSDESQWITVLQKITETHGGLNVLVNNAGVIGPRDLVSPEDSTLDDWRKIFSVNVDGVFLGCKRSIPVMHASGGGAIVNIASIASMLATPHATAYGASKAAVRHITKSVAQHCLEKKMKIRCNSLHPGDVLTPMFESYAAEAAGERGVTLETVLKEWRSTIPMGCFVDPQDVAEGVVFLASEDSRLMTGAKLVIDAGSVHCDTYHRRVLRDRLARSE